MRHLPGRYNSRIHEARSFHSWYRGVADERGALLADAPNATLLEDDTVELEIERIAGSLAVVDRIVGKRPRLAESDGRRA